MQIKATFSILTRFLIVFVWNRTGPHQSKQPSELWLVFEWFFVWNHTRPRKSKQPFKFWPVFEWFLYEILLDHPNWSNLFNFDPFLNGFCRKSYSTTQIEGTFSTSTSFWMVFERNPTRPCKSKQPFKLWLAFGWFLKKSYQTMQIEATFLILTRFWMVFVWNHIRPRKSKQPFQFWIVFNGFCMKS